MGRQSQDALLAHPLIRPFRFTGSKVNASEPNQAEAGSVKA